MVHTEKRPHPLIKDISDQLKPHQRLQLQFYHGFLGQNEGQGHQDTHKICAPERNLQILTPGHLTMWSIYTPMLLLCKEKFQAVFLNLQRPKINGTLRFWIFLP
jgi:hypothetical protein